MHEPAPNSLPNAFTIGARVAAGLLALVAGLGLARYLIAETVRLDGNWLGGLWVNAGYLTDLSNFMLAIVMGGIAFGRSSLTRPGVVGWAVTAVLAVGVGFLMVGGRLAWSSSTLEDILLHGVTPWAALLFWLAFAPKGMLTRRHVVTWLAWPVLYWSYAIVRGILTGKFAYPFIDLAKVGISNAALFISMVIGVFLACATMMLLLDRVLRPKYSTVESRQN